MPTHKIRSPNSFSTFENPFENIFSSFFVEKSVFSITHLGLYLLIKVHLKFKNIYVFFLNWEKVCKTQHLTI